MRSDRLLELAGHLERLWPDVFDMTVWAEIRNPCGTVCCALGHACSIFADEGLRLRWDYAPEELRAGDAAVVRYFAPGPCPVYPPAGYAAAAVFFEIAPEDAIHLFAPFAYRDEKQGPRTEPHDITPYEVAARIREFVADHGREPGRVVFR